MFDGKLRSSRVRDPSVLGVVVHWVVEFPTNALTTHVSVTSAIDQ